MARPATDPAAGTDGRDNPGQSYERSLPEERRRALGAYYTPAALADAVARETLLPLLADRPAGTISVCDPAVGGGALLSAAARLLAANGAVRPASRLTGTDIDAEAVTVAGQVLGDGGGSRARLVVANALTLQTWPEPGIGAFDAVIANPPFLGQLRRTTARSRGAATAAAQRFGVSTGPYTDDAALFLLLALDLVRPGGRVGIILPESLLATRDGATIRQHVGSRTRLTRLWIPRRSKFAPGIRVCVAVFEKAAAPSDAGDEWSSGRWAALASASQGVPVARLPVDGTLGDVATIAADFRDQFYGVAAVAVDAADPGGPERPKLVTCGLIDPATTLWGRRSTRIAGRVFTHPRADLGDLEPDEPLARWARSRLVPKALLATQTRVLEAAADPEGDMLPVVPVISVVPSRIDLWHALAVLHAPPIAAHARREYAGSALSSDAIKLSAAQVAQLPLPSRRDAWDEGAARIEDAARAAAAGDEPGWRAAMHATGTAMCEAYGMDDGAVMAWWWARLTPKARADAATRQP